MRSYEITIKTRLTPGYATFDNYHEVKNYLEKELYEYNHMIYSMDNIDQATADYAVLKSVRKKLTEKRKELERAYTMPIEEVMSQLDELIEMVKVPFTVVDKFLKTHEKDIKQREIMAYAYAKSNALGIYANRVVESPSFFNPRWLNKTYRDRQWKHDVDQIIQNAFTDIGLIKTIGGEHENALLAFYFDKLSMNGVESFLETLTGKNEPEPDNTPPESEWEIDPVTGEILGTWDGDEGEWNPPFREVIQDTIIDNTETGIHVLSQEPFEEKINMIVELSGDKAAVLEYIKAAISYRVMLKEITIGEMLSTRIGEANRPIKEKAHEEINAQDRRGAPWSFEEDEALRSEFANGMSIAEASRVHKRTYGAIKARLIKLALIEK